MIVGCEDRSRTLKEVDVYRELLPLNQGTMNRIGKNFRDREHVREVLRQRSSKMYENNKFN